MCSWGLSEWGDIANIVLAIASVATAIVTAVVLCKQHKLQREQLNAQQLEHQPIFEFVQGDDSFTIISKGASMSSPAKIEITSAIVLEPAKATMEDGRYCRYIVAVPYKNYTNIEHTYNLSGKIIECSYASTETLLKLKQLVERVQWRIKNPISSGIVAENLPVYATDLIKIEYVDMYKIKRELYYYNLREIPQWLYNIISEAIEDFPFAPYDILELSDEMILAEIRKFKHRLPYSM